MSGYLSLGGGPPIKPQLADVSSTGCKCYFPMYCVPLNVVLEMKSVVKHEELLAAGVLVEHDFGDQAPVIFVSHQWLSADHPDPQAAQFAILQAAIRRLLAGYEVRSDWMHSIVRMKDEVDDSWPTLLQNAQVWYDYFSAPQEACHRDDLQLAIQSIPAYIEMSTVTFILAPTIDHHEFVDANGEARVCDYYTWNERGWCRLELFTTSFKVNARSAVVIRSANYMHFYSSSFLSRVACVAEGALTCCSLNHERLHPDGTASPIACDRPLLFDVMHTLVTHRLHYERTKGNLRAVRQLQAFMHIWLRDLVTVENHHAQRDTCDTLDRFLATYEFTPTNAGYEVHGGWTPLRFACISANVKIAQQLLDQKADVEANMASADDPDFPLKNGTTILRQIINLCCCSEHEDILHLLVAHKANLSPPKQLDGLVTTSSVDCPSKRGALWFLRVYPDWDVNRRSTSPLTLSSMWPLYTALCTNADLDYVRLLCAHNADLTLEAPFLMTNAFMIACTLCPTSSPEIPEYILRQLMHRWEQDREHTHGTSHADIPTVRNYLNRRAGMDIPYWTSAEVKEACALKLVPRAITETYLRMMGSTPLLIAASEGKHRICQWLLDHMADASIANMDGETALSLAEERGFTLVVDVLHGKRS